MFSTFATKKDIDRHVKTSLSKLPEHEKYQRGLAIARQYLKLNEFASAEHWLSCFLSVQEDSAQAHKLLGHCYERQKKIDRAITSYQRSLQLDSKQTGLITDVCKLLLSDDNFSKNLSKAKHWCDLAESERINHEAVLNLKLKVANKDAATDNKLVKEIILKEILARPLDPGLRIRLVKHFTDEKKLDDAFKYCYDIEMKFTETFQQSVEWANAISSMLTRYVEANANSYQSNWNYWLLAVMTLDRQIYLNMLADSSLQTIKQSNIREIATLLFELDQTLRKFADKGRNSCSHKQLAEEFLLHYRGQLLLHSASLLFKNEKQVTNSKSRDVTTKCLPLLFLAYQCGVPDSDEPWLRHTNDTTRQLVAFWNKQAAFRCCQAGSSILSCVDDSVDASVIAQIQSVTESKIWNTAEDLVNQVRQFCADMNWKKSIFRALYSNNGDQISKMSSSYFMQSASVGEPQYELPKLEHIQMYLEIAQYLCPSSLAYQIYLGLGVEDLAELRCKSFNGLNFSTNNLDNCNVETLNQLDVDSFLYCAILVAKSCLEGERKYQDKMNSGKPRILPAPNMIPTLCEENKADWWNAACAVFKNTKSANFSSNKQLLQHGLQAVRGTGTPITDVIVLLKLGKILAKRINNTTLPEERRQLELRTESVYKAGVLLWKMRNESSFNSTNIFFKYGIDSFECSQEAVKLAEDALTYLAGVYFKHGRYEEFTQDFGGIPLPFAAYFRAEAFKKLDESSKTPLKTKKFYSERARDCIKQTQKYLELPYIEKSHPLHYVVHSEIKRIQFNDSMDGGGSNLNSSLNGFGNSGADDSDHFQSFSSSNNADRLNRSEREIAVNYAARTSELESLIRNMMEVLTIVKDDVLNIRNDVGDIQERLVKIEDHIHKKPAEDDAATAAALNDLYILDELQNPSYVNQPNYNQALQQQLTPNLSGRLPPNHPAAAVAMQHPNPYQQFYNTSYPMYMQQYAAQQQQQQRAQMGAVASPLHTYQDSSLLVPASPYYQQQQQQQPPPQQPAPIIPPAVLPPQQPVAPKPTNSLFEQALQTPTVLNTWNSTYNATNLLQTSTPTTAAQLDKVPPVNVVITNSDPLPTNISVGTSQPTYSVTIPPQHIKHSVISNTTPAVTTVVPAPIASGIENISPVGQQQPPVNTKFPIAAPKVTMPTITPGMFSQSIAASSAINDSAAAGADEDDDDDDAANISGEYDPRPDFKPIIALPDEIEVKTGEEDEEQIFCGRSKLLRMVDREWKERGLGDLKILKSKADPSKYRIVMRREQVHKIAANHTITPELIIKPMEKNNKCYTWAAMDFADEEPKKETFCARFSTPELAKEFFDKFNQAKNEVSRLRNQQPDSTPVAAPTKTDTPKSTGFSFSTPKSSDSSTAPVASKPTFGSLTSKPIFGSSAVTTTPPTSSASATTATTSTPFQGFSFANNYAPPKLATPTASEKPKEPASASKPSPFASFTFGASAINSTSAVGPADSTSNKSFTDIFSSLNKLATPPSSSTVSAAATTTTPAALNTSGGGAGEEAVEEFVPTADFKPVIPLPDLVEVKTGEEGFDCVYEHRAKMFRMDKAAKEWKERGLGNIRVLVKKDDNNVARLLMRREQVLKLCCNQLISKDLKFTVSEKNNNTLTWVGHDYSENELLVETFAIRFKTADIARDFHNMIKKVQAAMTGGDKTDKADEPKKSEKKSEPVKGFGDMFKPKAGAWNCEGCYVSNKPDDLYCMACGGPKDSTVPKKESSLLDTLPKSTSKFSFGVQPAAATEAPKFSFGVPAAAATTTTKVDTTKKPEPKGFGDQFKPKAGSWTCSGCYISNKGDDLYCMACETPKDSTVPKKENKSNILGGGDAPKFNFTSGGGFSFGVPSATNATTTAPATTTGGFGSIGSTPGSGFSFTPTKTPAVSTTVPVTTAAATTKASFQFELPKPTMSFGSTLTTTTAATTVTEDKSAKPTVPEKSTFEFVFKPKSPGGGAKAKSPGRTISVGSEGEGAEEGGDDEGAAEEENNTYFTPVIPLPEKVEVKTGEEEEDALYSHRAKLFRFVDKEWKERGIGDVKILKHKTTGKLRVVMRRDQVLKICLNHALDADVQYQKKDEKSWQFVVNDFSEGAFEVMNFSLRFKTAEIAGEFRNAIDRALSGEESVKTPGGGKLNSTLESTISTPNSNFNYSQLSDISLDDKELTAKLKLPEGFFDSPKQPCKGCRGCDPDSFVFPSYGAAMNQELVDDKPLPVSVAQVKKVLVAPKLSKSPKKVSFSENTEEQKVTSLFGSVVMPSTTTTEPKSSPFSINSFVAAEKQSTTGNIFGSVSKPATADQGTPKSIFGGGFLSSTGTGSPATGSIFSSSLNTTPNPVIKPAQDAFKSPLLQPAAAFGTTTSSPSLNKSAEGVQLFGSSFGTSTPPTQSIFGGSPATTTNTTNSTTPVFGCSGNMTSKLSFGSVTATGSDQKVFGSGISFAEAAKGFDKKTDEKVEAPKADILEKADSGMSFASLASGTDGFQWNKKTESNSGFVGLTVKEDIFTRMANKSKNDSGAGDGEENDEAAGGGGGGDENYDPHYEPIIKLPDEIEVRTGEEDEIKLYGERAKLYRYDSDTKEWKERGVGELKILHHPGRNSYRLLLRREQIFKLVLNHAISSDLQITPMNNSGKAFVWGAMNHAEEGPQLEKLAARFKNEDLAASFKTVLEQCQEKLRQKPDLEPDQD